MKFDEVSLLFAASGAVGAVEKPIEAGSLSRREGANDSIKLLSSNPIRVRSSSSSLDSLRLIPSENTERLLDGGRVGGASVVRRSEPSSSSSFLQSFFSKSICFA